MIPRKDQIVLFFGMFLPLVLGVYGCLYNEGLLQLFYWTPFALMCLAAAGLKANKARSAQSSNRNKSEALRQYEEDVNFDYRQRKYDANRNPGQTYPTDYQGGL